ncbi:MAG TPA: hypothetical protein VGM88_20225 [Kofleriaceae bacterium]|jgi:hypothetical protein
MIRRVSPRAALLALLLAGAGCADTTVADKNEPTTAKEKQRREAEAKGELDAPADHGKGWRYDGDRNDCFFVVGHKCFKTQDAACKTCGAKSCSVTGGGPAQVTCT